MGVNSLDAQTKQSIKPFTMKVVHISMADFNGAGLCAYRICKAQRQLGIDSRMVVLRKRHHDDFITEYGGHTYFIHSVLHKTKKIFHFNDDLNTCRRLGKEHQAVYTLPVSPIDLTKVQIIRDADVIHLHWTGGFVDYFTFFKTFKDKVIVNTLHDENILYGIANIEQQRLAGNALERKYYQLKLDSTRVVKRMGAVFLSKMNYRLYADHEMIKMAQKRIIYNLVESDLFQPKPRTEARNRLNIEENKLVFAFCACNINEPRKGLHELSAAVNQINPDAVILAIGKNRGELLWNNVIEMGRINDPEEMSWVLSAADYFCLPSFKENFAQVPLEAMACGLPVVAFPCSGTEELITPENGVRCTDFTVDSLVDGIEKAMQTSFDGLEIRKDVVVRFSPEKIAQQYIDFYQQLLTEA